MRLSPAYRLFTTHPRLIHCLILIAAGLAVYANTFDVPFLFDDIKNIVENRQIRDLRNFLDPATLLYNRSFSFLTFALNYRLGGLDPGGYHAVNLALHLANSLVVYRLVVCVFDITARPVPGGDRRLSDGLALAAALLFVCHPLQTGAVTYIVQRVTLLAAFFYLLSLVMYLTARQQQAARGEWRSAGFLVPYAISLLSALAAMKCKEIAFTLPIMIVVSELLFFESRAKARICLLLPFLAAMAVIPLSMILSAAPAGDLLQQALSASRPTTVVSRMEYLLTQPRVLMTYIRLLLLPVGQNIDYDYPVYRSLFNIPVLLSCAFHIATIATALILLRRPRRGDPPARLITFGILWFYVTLAVESSVIPLDDVIFEHRLYLPSVGFMLLPAAFLTTVADRISPPLAAAGRTALIAAALLLALAAYQRNGVWQSGVSIWRDTAAKSPLKAKPHYNLGFYLARSNDLDGAIREFQTTLRLDPNHGKARNNLGTVYAKKGDLPAAIKQFREAALLEPDNATARFNLGYVLSEIGDRESAIAELRKGLQLDPNNLAAHNRLRDLIDGTPLGK